MAKAATTPATNNCKPCQGYGCDLHHVPMKLCTTCGGSGKATKGTPNEHA